MKKLTRIVIAACMMTVLVLPGCGVINKKAQGDNGEAAANNQPPAGGYKYTTNDKVTINIDQDVTKVLDSLGKPKQTFEAPSCAFQGVDKTFYYGSYQIVTYPLDGVDHISTIDLLDDTVSTEEGISLGSSLKEVVAAYGKDYTDEGSGFYSYTAEKTKLTFALEKDAVKQITYSVILGGTK